MRRIAFTEDMDLALTQAWELRESMDVVSKRMEIGRSSLYRRARELDLRHRTRYRPNNGIRFYKQVNVPERAHPLVKRLFGIMIQELCSFRQLSEKTGICPETISAWGERSSPCMVNIEACYNALGYRLVVRRNRSALP